MRVTVGVIGDFNPGSRRHRATDVARGHAADASSSAIGGRRVAAESLT
jgi:hypothetical protein